MPQSDLISRKRCDFPMLSKTMHAKPLIYFDSAATSQKPRSVIDAITKFYTEEYGTVHRAIYELCALSTHKHQEVRKKIANFLNAEKEEEIIFTRGTTESINLVAYSFGKAFVKPGDEILITEMEHHSNIVPWQLLCEDHGAILRVVPFTDKGELDLVAFENLLNKKTKIVAVTHMSNVLGTINPIKEIIKIAHAAGTKVLIDGAQAAAHLKIDVQDLDADFYVFSGHKIFGPTGVGVLYGKADLLNAMPPYQGGGDMIDIVTFEKSTYNALPLKFEAGTPMIAEVIGLGAAIDYIQELGLEKIHNWDQKLLDYATNEIQKFDKLRIIGNSKNKGPIISFTVEGIHALDIGTLLDINGIAVRTGNLCCQPLMRCYGIEGVVRASFAFYNTKEEIDSFMVALKNVIEKLS